MEKIRQFNTSGYIWETNNISIEGGEVKEISLDNSKPNMFVLQNPNAVDINISLSHIPTLYNYEFQVKANTTDTFGRPSSTTKVYLFNTGSTTANVKLFSVNDTFDMNILKNTNVSIDGATVRVEDNGVIKGFQAGVSLPAGTNTIGKVGLENSVSNTLTQINSRQETMLTSLDTTKSNVENINTSIGNIKTNTDNMLLDNDTIINLLNDVKTNTANIGTGSGGSSGSGTDLTTVETKLASLETKIASLETIANDNLTQNSAINSKLLGIKLTNYTLGNPQDKTCVYGNNATSFSYTATANETIHFNWFMNDGGLGTFAINDTQILTVMAGEQLNELEIQLNTDDVLTFTATEPMFRYKYFVY